MKAVSFLASLVVLHASLALAADQGPATFVYSYLSDHQKALFHAYAAAHRGGRAVSDETYWDQTLNTGEPTTFAAVTHALERTQLGQGLNGLDEIEQITEISGDVPEKPSSEQFNLKVIWKNGSYQAFQAVGFTYRIGTGHDGETGLSVLSSSEGLHLLWAKDGSASGHAHVDYRGIGLGDILGGGEGHLTAHGADIRAIGPERDWMGNIINNFARHEAWFGDFTGYVRRAD
jgi:hypothetical protein